MGGGGTNVNYPGPSQTEQDLQKEQLELLRLQRSETEAFKPILLEQYGIRPTYSTDGQLTGYEYTPEQKAKRAKDESFQSLSQEVLQQQLEELRKGPSALEQAQEEVGLLQAERTKKALSGTLDLSEGTTQRKAEEWKVFKENMARAGNPIFGDNPEGAFSTSSAGTQALKGFQDNWKLAEDAERRGEINVGTELLNQSTGLSSSLKGQSFGAASTLRQLSSNGVTGVPDMGTGSLLPGYIQALQPYQAERQGQFQANAATAQNKTQRFAGIMSLAGNALGSGAALYALSSKKYKKGIKEDNDKKALSRLRKTKVYSWRYKGEPETVTHHGPIVEHTDKELVAPTGEHLDVISYMGTMHSALRELDRKVSKKEAA